jgi:DNA-binding Lrp family transcriptional regulator
MMDKYNINQTTLKILQLYSSDYHRRLHTREIARETGVDVKATQQQLKRLERNNILSSQTIGRNKEHRLNTDNILTRYYMTLAETYASVTYLGEHYNIKKIVDETQNEIRGTAILFGSHAKGEEKEESDIDLFIITDNEKRPDFTEAGNLIGREINAKSTSRDNFLRGLENNDPLIIEVKSHHILLKGIDEFTEVMWRHYARG